MASFRKRGAHQWQAQVRRRGYPPESQTFDSRAAAERWSSSVEHEMDNDCFVSRVVAETTTLGEIRVQIPIEFCLRSHTSAVPAVSYGNPPEK